MDPSQPYQPLATAPASNFKPMVRIWRPVRVWPVYAALAAAVFVGTVVQGIALVPMMLVLSNSGKNTQQLANELMQFALSPMGLMVLSVPMQLSMLASGIVPAKLLDGTISKSIGLGAPKAPVAAYPVLVLSSLLPAFAGVALASVVLGVAGVDMSDSPLVTGMTRSFAGPFTLFIALVPGICEEVFFRGFAQRRLTRRYGPRTAILHTTLLFAIVHMAPVQVIFVIPIGLWLGYVAWRTDSIWLTILGHATINSCWYIWAMLSKNAAEGVIPNALTIGLFCVACVSFAVALVVLRRLPPGAGVERPTVFEPQTPVIDAEGIDFLPVGIEFIETSRPSTEPILAILDEPRED